MVSEKKTKDYVIVTSHRNEVSNAPSNNVIIMSSVGVVENYLYENVTETFCLGVVSFSTDMIYLTLRCLTYAIDAGNLDSLYSSTWLPYTCIGWLKLMSMVTPAY